ncbi:patatin-like phospholipase domain-containing protein [Sarocladium implicatum]|nr:patatin-like phospholipase domain-containing protein [Sarocladium implicatum]
MPPPRLRLLSLDGGGVRGISSLHILRDLMVRVSGDSAPAKPCEVFDMIGGTSTGGLIAIMLGRLQMTVDECIDAYIELSKSTFGKPKKQSLIGKAMKKLKPTFSADALEDAIKVVLRRAGAQEDALLAIEGVQHSEPQKCKVFVCAINNQISQNVCLRSYKSSVPDDRLGKVKIWEACRATSAALTYFPPITIGNEQFSDGGLRVNNPITEVWREALGAWPQLTDSELREHVNIVSIGTGVPNYPNEPTTLWEATKTLKKLALDTESVAEAFAKDKSRLMESGQYVRFNVNRGKNAGLDAYEKIDLIIAVTKDYIQTADTQMRLNHCADRLAGRLDKKPRTSVELPSREKASTVTAAQRDSAFDIPFSLVEAPIAQKFVQRPAETGEIEKRLLPGPHQQDGCRIFVLHGMGGIGKTQLAVDFARRHKQSFSSVFWLRGHNEAELRQSFIRNVRRIPQLSRYHEGTFSKLAEQEAVVHAVLNWLSQEGNDGWLLIFDNVDLDPGRQDHRQLGAYDYQRYLPGADHGAALITTRREQLNQAGDALKVRVVSEQTSLDIFSKWTGTAPVNDDQLKELLGPSMLCGLPLAIAQAATYIRKTGISVEKYISLYQNARSWPAVVAASRTSKPLVDYESSVGITWSLSLQHVRKLNSTAAALVDIWAALDNKDFSYDLFDHVIDLPETWGRTQFSYAEDLVSMEQNEWQRKWDFPNLPPWLYTMVQNEADFYDAMECLLDYSLAETQESVEGSDQNRSRYAMHPVVHTWASAMQDPPRKHESVQTAICLFFRTGDSYLSNPRQSQLLCSHGDRILDHFDARDNSHSFPLRSRCGLIGMAAAYYLYGQYERCIKACELARWQATSLPLMLQHEICFFMSLAYKKLKVTDKAIEEAEAAETWSQEAFGDNNPHRVGDLIRVADAYRKAGDQNTARTKFREALRHLDNTPLVQPGENPGKSWGDQRLSIGTILGSLNGTGAVQTDLQETLKGLKDVIPSTYVRIYSNSQAFSYQWFEVAYLCYKMSSESAAKWCDSAIEERAQLHGTNHQLTMSFRNLRARINSCQGHYQKAEAEVDEILALSDGLSARDAIETLTTIAGHKPDDDVDKVRFYLKALDASEAKFGRDDSETRDIREKLQELYVTQGQPGKSRKR